MMKKCTKGEKVTKGFMDPLATLPCPTTSQYKILAALNSKRNR